MDLAGPLRFDNCLGTHVSGGQGSQKWPEACALSDPCEHGRRQAGGSWTWVPRGRATWLHGSPWLCTGPFPGPRFPAGDGLGTVTVRTSALPVSQGFKARVAVKRSERGLPLGGRQEDRRWSIAKRDATSSTLGVLRRSHTKAPVPAGLRAKSNRPGSPFLSVMPGCLLRLER